MTDVRMDVVSAKAFLGLSKPTEHFCGKCRITFPIEKRKYGREFTRCSVPGCKQRFWHGHTNHPPSAIVGIEEADLPPIKATGEIAT